MKKKYLLFQCPICGNIELEYVTVGTHYIPVNCVEINPDRKIYVDLIWDTDVEADFEEGYYRCNDCGMDLKTDKNRFVTNDKALVKWLQEHGAKEVEPRNLPKELNKNPERLYIELLNGQADPDHPVNQEQSWGEDGPILGPFGFVASTQNMSLRINDYDELRFNKDGFLYYDGMYYKDWSIVTDTRGYDSRRIQNFDRSKSLD